MTMKFLLVAMNAKYIHSNPGLYSMRACVPQAYRESVEIAEYTINHRMEEVLSDLYERHPDVVGFSCYIWNWTQIKELTAELHKVLPAVPIWLGGPEVSYDAAAILEELPQLTGIMIGEGELTFTELLMRYLSGESAYDVVGTTCRTPDGAIIRNPERELTDLSTLPFLYEKLDDFDNRIIYYESGRGCPYRCSYCLSSIDKRVRLRDLSIVYKELQFFLDHNVSQVKFVDRTFNCNAEHALGIWEYLKEHDNGVTNFHFEIAAEILTEEQLAVLNTLRPGLVQLEIGVQTTNRKTLEAIHRPMKLDRLRSIVERLKAAGNIHIHLDLIAGLPYEDYESFTHSFDDVYRMHPEQLQLGFLKVLKGSEMQARAAEFGIIYTQNPPYEVLYSDWISYEELRRLKQVEEMVELYYNSNQFVYTLRLLEGCFATPFLLYDRLAAFYKEEGYLTRTPARGYRYDVLYQFIKREMPQYETLFRETLLFDLFLRENVKKRPDFAPGENLSDAQKDSLRDFYKEQERQYDVLTGYQGFDAKQMSKMTHAESFQYPVDRLGDGCRPQDIKALAAPQLLLFDYRERNPLTQDARVVSLSC